MPRFHPRQPRVLRAASAPGATAPVYVEGRGEMRKAEGGRQKAEGRRRKAEGGRQDGQCRSQSAECRTEARSQEQNGSGEATERRSDGGAMSRNVRFYPELPGANRENEITNPLSLLRSRLNTWRPGTAKPCSAAV